jgi:hypothetical protein
LALVGLVIVSALVLAACDPTQVLGFEPNDPSGVGCCHVSDYNAAATGTKSNPSYVVGNADESSTNAFEGSVWGQVTNPGQFGTPSFVATHNFSLSVPLTIGIGSSFTQADVLNGLTATVNGTNDAAYRYIAGILRDGQGAGGSKAGYPNAIIRLGYEFDCTCMQWNAVGHEALWVSAYKHVHDIFANATTGSTTYKFDWCGLPGSFNSETSAYPGDSYVDIIGLDVYDQGAGVAWNSTTDQWVDPQAAWNTLQPKLQFAETFAVNHSKVVSYPEWGLSGNHPNQSDANGGDDPTFIHNMFLWMKGTLNGHQGLPAGTGPGSLAYVSYFDTDPSFDHIHQISQGHFPNALAEFQTDFSTTTTTTTTTP